MKSSAYEYILIEGQRHYRICHTTASDLLLIYESPVKLAIRHVKEFN
jgi:hypothetical protein